MDGMKTCSACREQVRRSALICGFCRLPLVSESDMRLKSARAKAAAINEGRFPPTDPGPGRLTGPSFSTCLVLACAAVLLAIGFAEQKPGEVPIVLAFGLIVVIPGFFMMLSDLLVPPPSRRLRSGEAIAAFFGALSRRRYGRAYACVTPLDRNQVPRMTFETPSLESSTLHATFESAASFARYWGAMVGRWDRRLRHFLLETENLSPSAVIVTVEVRIRGISRWAPDFVVVSGLLRMAAAQREDSLELRKLVILHDGRWWLANGELSDAEDETIAALLQESAKSASPPA